MAAAVMVLAAGEVSAGWQIAGPIIVAVLGVLGGIYASRSTLRAANSTNATSAATSAARNDQDRDKALDDRVDAENARLWTRVDELERRLRTACTERDTLAEAYARLRLGVIGLGHDPDALIAPLRPAVPPHAEGTPC